MPNLSANQKPVLLGQRRQIWPLLRESPIIGPLAWVVVYPLSANFFELPEFLTTHTQPHIQILKGKIAKPAAMAPKAEKKPAKKVAKKVAGGKGKKGKSKVESFKIYIYKVLKQVRPRPSQLSCLCLRLSCAGNARGMTLTLCCM